MIGSKLAIAGVMGLAAICPAHAAGLIFANLTDSSLGSRTINPTPEFQSFFNVAGGSFLTDVQLLLSGNNTDSHIFSVDLYANSSTSPGTLLGHIGSMSDSALIGSGNHVYDLPVATSIALSANTRYWIGLSTANASGVDWSIEGPFQGHPGDTGVTGEFIDDTGVVSSDNGEAFQMQITSGASAPSIPEPATFLLSGAGLISTGILKSRTPLFALAKISGPGPIMHHSPSDVPVPVCAQFQQ